MARLWVPTDATSAFVAGWFDASDASTMTVDGSARVLEWRSKVDGWKVSISANNAPTLVANGRNSLPAVVFSNNSGTGMSGAAGPKLPIGSSAGVMSGVASYVTQSTEYATLLTYGIRDGAMLRSVSAHSQKVSVGYYGNDQDGNAPWLGQDRMFTASIDTDGSSTIIADDTLTATAKLRPLATTANSTFWIGAGSNGDPWRNPVQELVIWNGLLSTADRQKLFGFYAWKWNLVSKLPTNHPYRTAAPMFDDGSSSDTGATCMLIWI
jgi:hypothetical protein